MHAISIQFRASWISFSSLTDAGFDGMVQIGVTFSTCLVYKIWYLTTFNFLDSKTIAHCQFRARGISFFFSHCNGARIDGMSVISLTYSICLFYTIWNLRTLHFLDSKAIAHCRSAIFVQFRRGLFLHYWSIQCKVWWYSLDEYDLSGV